MRITPDEALVLERGRAAARAMGIKLSDTAVFRLALAAFKPELLSEATVRMVLRADTRRKHL